MPLFNKLEALLLKKSIIVIFTLTLGMLTFSGCSSVEHSTVQTTDSTVLQAASADLTNSTYTLKVRKNMELVSGQLIFTKDNMEWTRTYTIGETETSQNTITLTNVKITTENDQYKIVGKEKDKEVTIIFTKIGNYRIQDEEGNIYSL